MYLCFLKKIELQHYNMTRSDFELLAPAGNFESLTAGIQGGANGIYFGVDQLNMRAKSTNNFSINDLPEVVKRCHQHQVKAYLALNTIVYDHEITLMHRLVDAAKDAQVDAIIASDQSVLLYASEKKVPIHISTQLNVSNLETLRFYSQYAETIVLARELSLQQIAYLTKKIREENITAPSGNLVRIEIFIHGALCMAISGKCYMSLHEYNASANRGACQQTCRRSYTVTDNETGYQLEIDNEYIMSPKDLATYFFFDEIINAGATVFKIEGRARSAEYVKTVTETYNDIINAVLEKRFTKSAIKQWEKKLKTVYNRDFWDYYYLGRKLGEWNKTYGSQATQRKEFIGRITNYFGKIGVAEITIDAQNINLNDELIIIGPTTGVVTTTITELRVDEKKVETANRSQRCSIPIAEKLRRSDKVYKIVKTEFSS